MASAKGQKLDFGEIDVASDVTQQGGARILRNLNSLHQDVLRQVCLEVTAALRPNSRV